MRQVLSGKKTWATALNKPFIQLENLIKKNLARAVDTLIAQRFEEKSGKKLMSIREVAKQAHKNYHSFQTACSQQKYMAVKRGGKLYSHLFLLAKP